MQKDSPPQHHPEHTRPAGAPTGTEAELWSRGHRPPVGPGRFAYDGLERVIHEKARLGIMTSLVAHPDGLLFVDLKELCALTDGNLNRHLQVLREAGLVEVWKGHRRNRPQTMCRITPQGRRRFLEYLGALEKVVADAAEAAQAHAAERPARRVLNGLSPA